MKYLLELTEEQAKIVSKACEFYARMKIGQFNEVIVNFLDVKENLSAPDYYDRKEKTEHALLDARKQIYPELHGIGHSYGIGKFDDADMSYDVHQVLRAKLYPASKREPFSYHKLPTCEVKAESEKKEDTR